MHTLPFERVSSSLAALGLAGIDEGFWNAIRRNLTKVRDAAEWWAICRQQLTPVLVDPDYVREAAGLLPAEPWTETTWSDWTTAVGAATARKGKALFMPLRLALTAREHGPELKTLLPMLGRARAEARLRGIAG